MPVMKRKYIFVPWGRRNKMRAVVAQYKSKRGMLTYMPICCRPVCPYPNKTCNECRFNNPFN